MNDGMTVSGEASGGTGIYSGTAAVAMVTSFGYGAVGDVGGDGSGGRRRLVGGTRR